MIGLLLIPALAVALTALGFAVRETMRNGRHAEAEVQS